MTDRKIIQFYLVEFVKDSCLLQIHLLNHDNMKLKTTHAGCKDIPIKWMAMQTGCNDIPIKSWLAKDL